LKGNGGDTADHTQKIIWIWKWTKKNSRVTVEYRAFHLMLRCGHMKPNTAYLTM
jgi:hypothetical protein